MPEEKKTEALHGTEIIRHGGPLSPEAEATLDLWKGRFDIYAFTGKFRYIIHIWQLEDRFHIEAGIRVELDGKTYSRAVMIGDSASTRKAFRCILERERYLRDETLNTLEETERMLAERFGYDGVVYQYGLDRYVEKFNGYQPVLMRADGASGVERYGHDGFRAAFQLLIRHGDAQDARPLSSGPVLKGNDLFVVDHR